MISKINFDRLVELPNDVPEKHEQIYEDVPGFESLRKIFKFLNFRIFDLVILNITNKIYGVF